jgi:SAM-dependent methyltransferase
VTSLAHDSRDLAETYDRVSDWQFEGGKRLIERLGLVAGERILDVGCGTGRLARWMSGIAGPGCVIGIDPLADRVALARSRVPGVSFEVGQAEDLGAFADASFDAVCMSAVFHWVKDKPKALAEARRVLRPRGRLGMTTLPKELRLASTSATVCAPIFGRKPYTERVNPAGLAIAQTGATSTDLITMLLQAGLDLAELHVVRRTHVHASGEAVVDFIESSSFGNFLRLVPDDLRETFRADLVAAFEATRTPEGIVLRDHALVVVASRG